MSLFATFLVFIHSYYVDVVVQAECGVANSFTQMFNVYMGLIASSQCGASQVDPQDSNMRALRARVLC